MILRNQVFTNCYSRHLWTGGKKRRLATSAVYTFGEAWSGSLGNGKLTGTISGHRDDDEAAESYDPVFEGDIDGIGVGWGHTGVLSKGKVYWTGRPHDFSALLRLNRLPSWIRTLAVRQLLDSTTHEVEAKDGNQSASFNVFNPSEMVANVVAAFSNALAPDAWDVAREQALLTEFSMLEMPDPEDSVVSMSLSAGFSSFVTASGKLYTIGLNGFGQCGIGRTSSNIWTPFQVTGLSAEFAAKPRQEIDQSHPIESSRLGLQHGVALNASGEVFCWGKGERGQLGQAQDVSESATAMPILRALESAKQGKPVFMEMPHIKQIAAGMLHNAALTSDNRILVWGKHTLEAFGDDVGKNPASDATLPTQVAGLPNLQIESVACGSHHTAALMEDGSIWAVGISADEKKHIHEPVCILPPGLMSLPVRQFTAHMDRTTVVSSSGDRVLHTQLLSDTSFLEDRVFQPVWLDSLIDSGNRIREVHYSWKHSAVWCD